jgi:hypothetical protein
MDEYLEQFKKDVAKCIIHSQQVMDMTDIRLQYEIKRPKRIQ